MARSGIESLFNDFEQSVMDTQEFNRKHGLLVEVESVHHKLSKVVVKLPSGGIFTQAEYTEHFSSKQKLAMDFSKTELVEMEFTVDSFDYLLLLIGNNGMIYSAEDDKDGEHSLKAESVLVEDELRQRLSWFVGEDEVSDFEEFSK